MNNRSGIELTFFFSSDGFLFIKIDSLKDSLNRFKKSLKLLLLCSCNNKWSDIADELHATLFPVKGDKPISSLDLTFNWRPLLP